MGQTSPQRLKIQARPVQLQQQMPKIQVGAADTDTVDTSLKMKRKGKKATRAQPSNTGLNLMG